MANERITLTVRANCKDIIVALWRVQSGLMDLLPVAPSVPDAPDKLERLDGLDLGDTKWNAGQK